MHARLTTCLFLGLLLLTACDNPMVGKWRSDQKLPNGQRNSMTVEDDLTGKATVYATPEYDHNLWVKFKFELEGKEQDDGFRFDFEMKCTYASNDVCVDKFDMDCKVYDGDDNGGLDKANCKGKGLWQNYPFDWERDD
jgi:hypothetical protein